MKELKVSLKTSTEVLHDFKNALKKAKKKTEKNKLKGHFEISFDSKNNFEMFIRNIDILMYIIHFKPKSIDDLARLLKKEVSKLDKIIFFYEGIGVLKIKKSVTSAKKETSEFIVAYDKIKFDLAT